MKTGRIFTGIAGEYFVAGELSRRGIVAALTLRNTADIDIVASSADGVKMANIQVKSRRRDKMDGWDMGNKPLDVNKNWQKIFYILVDLSSLSNEDKINYYVIPKNILNKKVEGIFKKWRSGLKKSGEKRKSERRMFKFKQIPELMKYKNRWDILEL